MTIKRKPIILILSLLTLSHFSAICDEKHNFQNSKNLDIFFNLYKQLDQYYVDSIRPDKAIRSGIDGMLSSLDPYTNFIDEKELDDFKFITTGEYGGIGSTITAYKGNIYISEPYENMPAAKSGLKSGDRILEINSIPVTNKKISEVSELLKGQPNTTLKIKYQRGENTKPKEVTITRLKITVSSVPYYGLVGSKTGYILINSFTDKTGAEVKNAFQELKTNHGITSLIIDLRSNGGGVMEEAIKVINLFVAKGTDVVSTRGKVKQWDRTYKTPFEPIDTEIPLAILVDKGSASASEIVAGALQDLDRAIIIGERTFGKGLVQTTRPVSFNTSLKVTIAKYYTPSGRCVQAIDYSNRNSDGSAGKTPDSLTNKFFTKNKRIVRDGGGVTPDIVIEDKKIPNIVYYLLNDFIIFDYATKYSVKHPSIGPIANFAITDEDYSEFKQFVKSKNFTYDRQSERSLKELKELIKFEGYYEGAEAEFKALEVKLTHDLDKSLSVFSSEIKPLIESEIAKRYYYQKGEIELALKRDNEVKQAITSLTDNKTYTQTLKLPLKRE